MVANIVDAVTDAFRSAQLPPRTFRLETDMEAVLLPLMQRHLATTGIQIVTSNVRRVPCFIPNETREPDGEARDRETSVALELKLLRGGRNDGGEFHRGFGQCFTYVASGIYAAAMLLVVHQGQPRSLSTPTAPIGLNLDPFRRVYIVDRTHTP